MWTTAIRRFSFNGSVMLTIRKWFPVIVQFLFNTKRFDQSGRIIRESLLSGRGIRSEENLKEFSGMMALTTGSKNKAGQNTVSFQAGGQERQVGSGLHITQI